jgi:hypothetical protein
MSADKLYTQIFQAIDDCADETVDSTTRQRLALLVLGMIEAKSASPARIAQAIHRLGLSQAQPNSIERRIRRLENDPEISDACCFHPFARERLLWAKGQELLLILDPTTQDDRVYLVTVAVWYRGRALPLAWVAWAANTPLVGDRFWARIAKLLACVANLLPKGVTVTWLADRAFGTPAFLDLLTAHGWFYVVRVQGHTRCKDRQGREKQIQHLIHPVRRRGKMRGHAFKKSRWRSNSMVAFWGKAHRTPLCLVSNLPLGWYLIRLYRRRYPIEATFRDYKSHGWQWEKGQVVELAHVERLLVGMAYATWFALIVGTHFADALLQKRPTGQRRTIPWWGKRSLFAIGLHYLRSSLMGTVTVSLQWPLTPPSLLNWQEEIYFHHARAFVFAS